MLLEILGVIAILFGGLGLFGLLLVAIGMLLDADGLVDIGARLFMGFAILFFIVMVIGLALGGA